MMRSLLIILSAVLAIGLKAQEYQLSKPLVRVEGGPLFEQQAKVTAEFRLEGAEIHYTLDGSEPTKSSSRYTEVVAIKENSTFKVKAFKAGYLPSETVAIEFVQLGIAPKSITMTDAHRSYQANGAQTLIDRKAGSLNFKDGQSLGFEGDTIKIKLDLGELKEVDELIISSITASGAWIMPPNKIEVFFSKDDYHYDLANKPKVRQLQAHEPTSKNYYRVEGREDKYQFIEITIFPLAALPEWHGGAGNPGWVFLDEIIIKE